MPSLARSLVSLARWYRSLAGIARSLIDGLRSLAGYRLYLLPVRWTADWSDAACNRSFMVACPLRGLRRLLALLVVACLGMLTYVEKVDLH